MRNNSVGKDQKSEPVKSYFSNDARKYFKAFISVFFSFFALMLCITIWVVNNISTAWFASNRTVSGSSMSVSVEDPIVQVDLTDFLIMGYIKDNGTFGSLTYAEMEAGGNITMLPYDTINTDNKNAYTPLVIRIPIKGTAVEAGEVLSIKLSIDMNLDWETTDYLSNIIEVRCVVPQNEETWDGVSPYNDLWETITKAAAQATPDQYVKWVGESLQKKYTLEFTVDKYTAEGGSLNVYLVIDYNDDLAKKYTKKQDSENIKFGETVVEVDFAYDFTNLNVSISTQQ